MLVIESNARSSSSIVLENIDISTRVQHSSYLTTESRPKGQRAVNKYLSIYMYILWMMVIYVKDFKGHFEFYMLRDNSALELNYSWFIV